MDFVSFGVQPLVLGEGIIIEHMGVSLNGGTPKSSILIGFSFIKHPFWGTTILGNTHIEPSVSE